MAPKTAIVSEKGLRLYPGDVWGVDLRVNGKRHRRQCATRQEALAALRHLVEHGELPPAEHDTPRPRADANQGLKQYDDGSWGIDCWLFGRRVRRKIGKKSEARDELVKLKAAERQGQVELPSVCQRRKTLADWIDEYCKLTRRSKTDTKFALKWRQAVGHLYPEQLKLEDVRTWAHARLQMGRKPASVTREMDPLRTIYKEIERTGEITVPQNPFRDRKALKIPKRDNRRHVDLPMDAQMRIMVEMGPRWWPYALFLLLTGIRLGSLAKMRWEHVNWESEMVLLEETKSGRKTWVILSSRAMELLKQQRQLNSEWCWPSERGRQLDKDHFRRVWEPAFERAGVGFPSRKFVEKRLAHCERVLSLHRKRLTEEGRLALELEIRVRQAQLPRAQETRSGLTIHDLKHVFVTRLVRAGVPATVVRELADHGDLATTQLYMAHNNPQGREAMELLARVSCPSVAQEKAVQKWQLLETQNALTV